MQPDPPPGPPPGPSPGPQQPYAAYPPPARPTNTLAIIALICAFVFAPAGLVCGIIARRQVRQTGEQGDGMALAGIIVGWVFVGLFLLLFLVWLAMFGLFAAIFASVPWSDLPAPSDTPTPFPTS